MWDMPKQKGIFLLSLLLKEHLVSYDKNEIQLNFNNNHLILSSLMLSKYHIWVLKRWKVAVMQDSLSLSHIHTLDFHHMRLLYWSKIVWSIHKTRMAMHQPIMSSIYFWIALMLPAATSSTPEHAWTCCFVQPWTFHFIVIRRRRCLGAVNRVILCFCLVQPWTIIASAQRNSYRRKWSASDRAKHLWWNWSYTVPSDLRGMRNRWVIKVTRV